MRPFNLKEMLDGKPVVMRNGQQLDEFHFFKTIACDVKLVGVKNGDYFNYNEDGVYWRNDIQMFPSLSSSFDKSPYDLFMKSEKKNLWMFISKQEEQKSNGVLIRFTSVTYNSEKDAKYSAWKNDEDFKLISFEVEV
jgi:hypothetical protein